MMRPQTRPSLIVFRLLVGVALVVGLASCGTPSGSSAEALPSPSNVLTPSPQPSDPQGSVGPSAAPSAQPVTWQWSLGPLPGGPVRGAGRVGSLWVALDDLRAWTSPDGIAWDAAVVDDSPQEADGQLVLGRVAMLDGNAYSIGQWFGPGNALHPVVWRSVDGASWTQVPPASPWGYLANDVATDGTQLVVAGSYYGYGDGRVWTSTDARMWTERVSSGGAATLIAIHGDGDGFVAVGFRVAAGGDYVPTVWYSADGVSWADAAVPAIDTPVTLLDVARIPGGRYVALGIRGNEVDAGQFVAWYADDPSSWTDAGVIARGMLPGLLAAVDGGAFVITTGFDGPQITFSEDGVAWDSEPALELPEVLVHASAVASDSSDVVILGSTEEMDAHYVWLGRHR